MSEKLAELVGGDLAAGLLARARSMIDDVDAQMVALLGQRFKLTRQVGKLKAAADLPSRDAARETEQQERLAQLAVAENVDPELVRRLFSEITDCVVAEHDAMKAQLL